MLRSSAVFSLPSTLLAPLFVLAAFVCRPQGAPAYEVVNNCCITAFSPEPVTLDSAALNRVVERLGNVRSTATRYGMPYRLREGLEADYYFGFRAKNYSVRRNDTLTVLNKGRIERLVFETPGSIHLYDISASSLFAPRAAREVSNFLTSAYLLETGVIAHDSAQYLKASLKSDGEFWKRNLISQGWGAQYIYSGNPYGKNGWLPTGFGYLLDAGLIGGAVALAVGGDGPGQRIGGPLALIGTSLGFKVTLNGWLAKPHMDLYNRLVGSGYPLPKNHWRGLRKARFDPYPPADSVRRVTPQPFEKTPRDVMKPRGE